MTKGKELLKKLKEQYKKKPVIIATIAIVIILVILCIVIIHQTTDHNEPTATATPTPTQASATTPPAVTAEAVTTEAATATPQATVTPTEAPAEENTSNNTDLTISDPLAEEKAKQAEFDQHIASGNYDAAHELLENFYKDDAYSNKTLDTFNNYVTYYETQQKYIDSIHYQLDYIETNDGFDNVRKESKHYQQLQETLALVPDFQDERLAQIEASVTRWSELSTLHSNKDYTTVIKKAKDYIKNGPECVLAYLYLAEALDAKKEYFEEAKVYYIYLSKYSENCNLLESSYIFLFSERINALYDTGLISDKEKTYLEEELDLNYLN